MTKPVTLAKAVDDIDEMRKVYGPEELRVESNFIALLIPTAISLLTATLQPNVSVAFRTGFLWFLVVYLAAILYDLARVSYLNGSAKKLQDKLYVARGRDPSPSTSELPDNLKKHYQGLKDSAPKRKYLHPLAKIALALIAFAIGFQWSGG